MTYILAIDVDISGNPNIYIGIARVSPKQQKQPRHSVKIEFQINNKLKF